MSPDPLDTAGHALADAEADPATRADVLWLADTMRRAQLRLGRALAALGGLPALFTTASQLQTPDAAYHDTDGIAAVVRMAMEELEAIEDYAWAVTDPGEASCRACGARLGCFLGHDGLRHWRTVADPAAVSGQRRELFETSHEPDPVWARPTRPEWAAREGEQALNAAGDNRGKER
jgi:hypothetical protein